MIFTITLHPIERQVAMEFLNRRYTDVTAEIASWQKRQNAARNYNAEIPPMYADKIDALKEMMSDIQERDQGIFWVDMAITHFADSLEELACDKDAISTQMRKNQCVPISAKFRQEDTFNSVMPYGIHLTQNWRSFTTESLTSFIPFSTQEVMHSNGMYYGINRISGNFITVDRTLLLNGNGFILGVPGSGKSFAAKQEIIQVLLRHKNTEVLVIDPEREFDLLAKKFNGTVVNISATSPHHINPMELAKDVDKEDDPVTVKSEFMLAICEQLLGKDEIGPREKSIVDRCVGLAIQPYLYGKKGDKQPTFKDFYDILEQQPEVEAKRLKLGLELFIKGNLNTFAHETNVNMNSRFMVYDILDLGVTLKDVGMNVVLDGIFNRVVTNRKRGVFTWVYIDEIWLMMKHLYSAEYLQAMWKRLRKYGGVCTGITQNITDLTRNEIGRSMVDNAEMLQLFKQSANDRAVLSELINLSETQSLYMTNVEAGEGVIRLSNSIIPFKNEFDRDTELYSIMTTKLQEVNRKG